MSPDLEADVVIAGAGVAGLGLACALARHGVRAVLVEARKGPGGVHRGDSLLPKATRLLGEWGALPALRRQGARALERLSVHHPSRGLLFEGPLVPEDEPAPYLVLPHERIERALEEVACAGGATVVRQARVVDLVRDGRGAVTGLRLITREGEAIARARLVVGADGQRSVVRARLGIDVTFHAYDHAYLGLEADRPPGLRDALRLHLHPGGGLLVLPRADDRLGLGLLVEAGSSPRWLGLPERDLAGEVAARAPWLAGAGLHRERAHVYALSRSHAARYARDGAVLIGDAAHTTNPAAGQGMSSALQDAAALARQVGPALAAGVRDLRPALDAFETEARPENERLASGAHLLATLYASRGPWWDGVREVLVRGLGTRLGAALGRRAARAFMSPPGAQSPPALPAAPARALLEASGGGA